jgi:hypothetical protein
MPQQQRSWSHCKAELLAQARPSRCLNLQTILQGKRFRMVATLLQSNDDLLTKHQPRSQASAGIASLSSACQNIAPVKRNPERRRSSFKTGHLAAVTHPSAESQETFLYSQRTVWKFLNEQLGVVS